MISTLTPIVGKDEQVQAVDKALARYADSHSTARLSIVVVDDASGFDAP